MLRLRTADPVHTVPFFLFVQLSHWRAFDVIGVRCVLHLPFLSIRITLWMDFVAAIDDNAFDDGGRLFIPIWLVWLVVVGFLMRDSVCTKCGDTSAGCKSAMGKFGSDCGAASILCTDMLRLIIPPFLLEPLAWPLLRRWLVPFMPFVDESVTIRSSSVWMRLEFVWMKTPSHVIFIVVTILLVACEIAFVCHALHNCSLIACQKLRTHNTTSTQIAFSQLLAVYSMVVLNTRFLNDFFQSISLFSSYQFRFVHFH